MTGTDFLALSPIIALAVGASVLLLQIAFIRNLKLTTGVTLITFLACLFFLFYIVELNHQTTPLLLVDPLSTFFSILFVLCACITTFISYEYLKNRPGRNDEFFLLLVLATMGSIVLSYATHLASFILGLELMGIALYGLIAYPHQDDMSLEAAIKYLVLSGASSAALLFGFALLYAITGSLFFPDLLSGLASPEVAVSPQSPFWARQLILLGSALILAGISFKLSLAPFHMWTPDVYEGSPAPITGFLATISKGAVFAATLRLYVIGEFHNFPTIVTGLTILSIISILVGNLLALRQENIKRLLAYSSIAHFGYLLIALIAAGTLAPNGISAIEPSAYYLAGYIFTTLIATGLIAAISSGNNEENANLSDIAGLFWKNPLLALCLSVSLLSLAGIPLTAGFIGKLYIFQMGVESGAWLLLSILIIGSGIGIYYYLRLIFSMTTNPSSSSNSTLAPSFSVTISLVTLTILVLYLGIYPQPLMEYLLWNT